MVAQAIGLAGAGCLTWLAWQTGSTAATAVSAALVLVALLLLAVPQAARWLPWVAAAGVLLALGGTVVLATGAE